VTRRPRLLPSRRCRRGDVNAGGGHGPGVTVASRTVTPAGRQRADADGFRLRGHQPGPHACIPWAQAGKVRDPVALVGMSSLTNQYRSRHVRQPDRPHAPVQAEELARPERTGRPEGPGLAAGVPGPAGRLRVDLPHRDIRVQAVGQRQQGPRHQLPPQSDLDGRRRMVLFRITEADLAGNDDGCSWSRRGGSRREIELQRIMPHPNTFSTIKCSIPGSAHLRLIQTPHGREYW